MNEEEQSKQRNDLAENVMNQIIAASGPNLTSSQINAIKHQLNYTLSKYTIEENEENTSIIEAQQENARILRMFIDAKRIEGRSDTTLYNYAKELTKLFLSLNKLYKYITSKDIREYMAWRKDTGKLSTSSIANMRQYMMSFFKWAFNEELITKNPMDRIGVVKVDQHVIQVLSEEEQEIIRCACSNERDRAIIDLLSGSGMRVSELCGLNRTDIDLDKKECKVLGKGSKERICFLTGRCKVHLEWYLRTRKDDNPALFVTLKQPYNRITKNGIEYILRTIAKKSAIPTIRLYPHKYRSTLITDMINSGCDPTIVQNISGHSNLSTTMNRYYKSDVERYKLAHKHYVT
jgi:site-specific recombinase XerD